jgi:hypothetical protein
MLFLKSWSNIGIEDKGSLVDNSLLMLLLYVKVVGKI